MAMTKQEYLQYLDDRDEDERRWADKLRDNHDERIGHLSAAWAFRLARLVAEQLDG